MEQEKELKRRGGFLPGHKKVGGRTKGTPNKRTQQVTEILERLQFHPSELLAIIAKTGHIPHPDGTTTPVDTAHRIDCCKALAPYAAPKLASMEVNNETESPQVVMNTMAILKDPKIDLNVLHEIALALAGAGDETAPRNLTPGMDAMYD